MRVMFLNVFFFNDTATTEIYTLSLHDALPICNPSPVDRDRPAQRDVQRVGREVGGVELPGRQAAELVGADLRSEEHTSELQSRQYLVCRLLLEKKKTQG